MITTPAFQSDVLQEAAVLLLSNGFETQRIELTNEVLAGDNALMSSEALIAENALFVTLVLHGEDIDSLRTIEPLASGYLAEALGESKSLGPKAWDGYVVLLATALLEPTDDSTAIEELAYDTRSVRRIVRLGVLPTRPAISAALRAFLPLEPLALAEVATDVLSDLTDALASEGIARDAAESAVATYRRRREDG